MSEKKYINADLLKEKLNNFVDMNQTYTDYDRGYDDCLTAVQDTISDIPAADVMRIVKCEKCKYARFQYNDDKYPFGVYSCEKQPAGRAYKKVRGDFFCAYGTKMDKEQEDNV